MSEWPPIETAPKDGSEIILRRGKRVTAGCWHERVETSPEYDSTGEYIGRTVQDGGALWISNDGGFTEEEPPTHWMPLPEPPHD